jgi:hypothetical protein
LGFEEMFSESPNCASQSPTSKKVFGVTNPKNASSQSPNSQYPHLL